MIDSSYLAVPYSVGSLGSPRTTDYQQHVRDMIMSVLFTNPGERVNLPTFGAGIGRLTFGPNGTALIATAQFLISTNLQHWLSDILEVQSVTVSSEPGYEQSVTIDIAYVLKATGASQQLQVRA
jgi:phage baseplate assembly protein W